MTEVIEQIGIAWSLRERSAKVVNGLGKLTSLDLCDSEGLLRTDFLEMWYGFRSIALCQESVAEKLVRDRQIGAQLQRSFQRANRGAVVMLFHVRRAEIHECVCQSWVDFGCLAKLRYFHVDLMLFARFEPTLHMLQGVGRSGLSGQPDEQEKPNHERSGSRSSRN